LDVLFRLKPKQFGLCLNIKGIKMTKKEWLEEKVFRDIYGRTLNLSDVPMTYMTRIESFEKQNLSGQKIDKYWKEYKHRYIKE
jgi:hypothetical protein